MPGVEVKRSETSFCDSGNSLVARLPVNLEYKRACVVRCDSVALEKRISSMIPDIVIKVAGKQCLVEIAVTHPLAPDWYVKIAEEYCNGNKGSL